MKNQMCWGLATLIVLLAVAGIFLLIPQNTDTEPELVLSEETKKLLADKSQQQHTPSPGYFYHDDENGVPKLYAENQQHFRLTGWTEGYGNTTLLSDEELERYKALIPIANQTRLVLKEGIGTRDTTMFPDDVAALAREWLNELWEKTKSPLPTFSSFAQYTRPETPEDQERETQFLQELYDTHVPPDTRPSHANHVLIKSILNELKAELISN